MRQVFSTLLELIQIGRLSDQEKDLEILVLRKQLAMMEQHLDKPVRLSRAERLTLAVIGTKLKTCGGYLVYPSAISPLGGPSVVMVQPTENGNSNNGVLTLRYIDLIGV